MTAFYLPHPLETAAQARPAHLFLQEDKQQLTFSQTLHQARLWAAFWRSQGLVQGDVVVLVLENRISSVLAVLGLLWLGVAFVPLDIRAHSGAQALRAACACARTHGCTPPTAAVWAPFLPPDCQKRLQDACATAAIQLCALPDNFHSTQLPAACDLELNAVFAVVLTSGSSRAGGAGTPVFLRVHQWLFGAFGALVRAGHSPQDVFLNVLPLAHVGGLAVLLRCLCYQTTLRLAGRTFAPAQVAQALVQGQISHVSLVPQMLQRTVLAMTGACSARVRQILVGGGACDPALAARARARGLPLALTYGMTETCAQVATTFAHDVRPDAPIPVLPFVRLSTDCDSCIQVQGPCAPDWHQGGALVSKALATRDLGTVDNGVVRVRGRLDQAINSGGEKIIPEQVETCLRAHPDIRDACVCAAPCPRLGQTVCAFVVCDQASPPISAACVRRFVQSALGPVARPTFVVRLDALPRTAAGKPLRAALTHLASVLTPAMRTAQQHNEGSSLNTGQVVCGLGASGVQSRAQLRGDTDGLERDRVHASVHNGDNSTKLSDLMGGGGLRPLRTDSLRVQAMPVLCIRWCADDTISQLYAALTDAAQTRPGAQLLAQPDGTFELGADIDHGQQKLSE